MTDKKLSVIISNRNDSAMLVVTIRSCIEELRCFGPGNTEIVICDNSDPAALKLVRAAMPSGYERDGLVKFVRQDFPCLFTAREKAAENASGDYIVCLDSHMLVGRGMFRDLFLFMERNKDDPTMGFAHAPINWAHHHESRNRHDRDMSQHELGDWGIAYDHERTITWKGMPWICRRQWFLDKENGLNGYGALSEHRLSWGGGDMHIGVKPWLLGYKNWAVPTNAGIHIGPFPKVDVGKDKGVTRISKPTANGYRYRTYGTSGTGPHTIGFLVSCYVLGGEPMMLRNKPMIDKRFGRFIKTDKWWKPAMKFGENEKKWLDAHKVMTFEEMLAKKPWGEVQ